MSNVERCFDVLQELLNAGVRDFVICAGARNAPFVVLLSENSLCRVWPFFEERSASFFALGRMQATGSPVAVITTSGTAAAELLPALIEADYQGLPLIAVTADRPRRYRGSGAPQSINQNNLYSEYVEQCWDLETEPTPRLEWSRLRPLHLNVCLDEPLIDEPSKTLTLSPQSVPSSQYTPPQPLRLNVRKPLVIASGLKDLSLKEILRRWQRPVYCEASSGLRGQLGACEIWSADQSLRLKDYDAVIRIGRVPTLRLWRDLEKSDLPVFNFSDLRFSGLPRVPEVYPLERLPLIEAEFEPWSREELTRDRQRAIRERELFETYPLAEPSWVQWLSHIVPSEARVFLGNSLPIREWDLAALRSKNFQIFANRGVNGIDGLVSTFLGMSSEDHSNWALLGDLSTLYDLSGPWAARLRSVPDLNLVILNNGGGEIFKRMFRNPLFENRHDLSFSHWAEMWGWDYVKLNQPPETLAKAKRPRVIEIVPSAEQSEAFYQAWGQL